MSAIVLFALLAFQLDSADPGAAANAVRAGDSPGDISDLGFGSTDDEESLRRRLIELTTARAARFSPDELRIAIAAAASNSGTLPPAACEILGALRSQVTEIQAAANRKIVLRKRETIADLKVLLVKFTRDGQLDEAVAVRDLIRAMRMPLVVANADPGSMSSHSNRVENHSTFVWRAERPVPSTEPTSTRPTRRWQPLRFMPVFCETDRSASSRSP
jgi:hypothetical protein